MTDEAVMRLEALKLALDESRRSMTPSTTVVETAEKYYQFLAKKSVTTPSLGWLHYFRSGVHMKIKTHNVTKTVYIAASLWLDEPEIDGICQDRSGRLRRHLRMACRILPALFQSADMGMWPWGPRRTPSTSRRLGSRISGAVAGYG